MALIANGDIAARPASCAGVSICPAPPRTTLREGVPLNLLLLSSFRTGRSTFLNLPARSNGINGGKTGGLIGGLGGSLGGLLGGLLGGTGGGTCGGRVGGSNGGPLGGLGALGVLGGTGGGGTKSRIGDVARILSTAGICLCATPTSGTTIGICCWITSVLTSNAAICS